jgi:predicted Zn-dependent protease with MMP-like domain
MTDEEFEKLVAEGIDAIDKSFFRPEDIKKAVKDTVWHEIAHHFGMDEHQVRQAEQKRRE